MVTIVDVAARAGVGAGTVSRVLNNRPNVRETTRARVLAAMEALDYRPNPMAQGLSRGRCRTVGVLIPFFTQASAVERLRGVVAALDGSRYDLVLFNVESPVHASEHLATLNRQRTDGLVVMSLALSPEQLARLVALDIAVVLVDTYGHPSGHDVPMVVIDDAEGGRIATRHLVALGHERIAFIGEPSVNTLGFTSSTRRRQGYEETLDAAGVTVRDDYERFGPHDQCVARRLTEELLALDEPPSAIFACSDVQATGVLEAARAVGLRVPRDLSVVGFDDIEVAAYARLTTVRQPLFDSGALGAQLLLDALNGGVAGATVHTLPLELVNRSTTAKPGQESRARQGGLLASPS